MTRAIAIHCCTFFCLAISNAQLSRVVFDNYLSAVNNTSTFQYFVVVTIKDPATGQYREVCSKGNFLLGALHREFGLGYSEKDCRKIHDIAVLQRERRFELKKKSAIANLSISDYSIAAFEALEHKVNFDSLANAMRLSGQWEMAFDSDSLMNMYAHALFNRGILTGENSCFGGTLEYVQDKRQK
jgi:hypothetical protein